MVGYAGIVADDMDRRGYKGSDRGRTRSDDPAMRTRRERGPRRRARRGEEGEEEEDGEESG